MTQIEAGGISELDILAVDEDAFTHGRQFLDVTLEALRAVEQPCERLAPRLGLVAVNISCGLDERMFFAIGPAITVHEQHGVNRKGDKSVRRRENIVGGVDLTEAEEAKITFLPGQPEPFRAIFTSKFRSPNQSDMYENGLLAVSDVYQSRYLGRISLAVVSKEDFPD